VTLVFLGVGYMLDRWLGTKPVFTIVLVVLALIGEFVRFWYDYDARMKVLEAQRAAGLRSSSSPTSSNRGDRP
jgi:F0F1-type ATP synthase assembly protein I